MPNIKLQSITVDYGRVRALDELTLEITSGDYVVILGPSGAGKTTLLKVIAGLVRPKKGTILVDDMDVTDLPPEERRVAYLPQHYALFPRKNVWENVIFSPRMQGMDKNKAEELVSEILDMVNLRERADAFPHELSGGMKQRVALARAIATNFSILLLDEPLRALDARLRLALRNELRKMAKDLGFTVLHVTHDQEEAMSVADKIVVLRKGKIEQVGTQEEIYLMPKTRFVAEFVGETNSWLGKVIKKTPLDHFSRPYLPPALQHDDHSWFSYHIRDEQGNVFNAVDFKDFNVGDDVQLMIKYEALRLLKDTGEPFDVQIEPETKVSPIPSKTTSSKEGKKTSTFRLKGTVKATYYLGKWTHVVVTITNLPNHDDDKEITWTCKLPSITARRFTEGERVMLEINPHFVFLFPHDKEKEHHA